MTEEEYQNKKNKLEKLEKGYNTNAGLAGVVAVLIVYPVVRDRSWVTMPWYILLILGVLTAAAVVLAARDWFLIKDVRKRKTELENLYKQEQESSV